VPAADTQGLDIRAGAVATGSPRGRGRCGRARVFRRLIVKPSPLVAERDVDAEPVHDPQPKPKSLVPGAG